MASTSSPDCAHPLMFNDLDQPHKVAINNDDTVEQTSAVDEQSKDGTSEVQDMGPHDEQGDLPNQ